jgi:hypothetical protein
LGISASYGTLDTTFEEKRTSVPAGLQGLAQGNSLRGVPRRSGTQPEYRSIPGTQAKKLDQEAAEIFDQRTQTRESADQYVPVTVSLATVLLLAALSQPIRTSSIRACLIALAFLVLLAPLWRILTLPRL